jgi:hypothetical protein
MVFVEPNTRKVKTATAHKPIRYFEFCIKHTRDAANRRNIEASKREEFERGTVEQGLIVDSRFNINSSRTYAIADVES